MSRAPFGVGFGESLTRPRWMGWSKLGFALINVVWLFAGCASGPSYSEASASIPPLAPAHGRIFIYRPSRFIGSAVSYPMVLNNGVIGRLANGGSLYVDCAPGTYSVTSLTGWEEPVLDVEVGDGQTIYLQFANEITHFTLKAVPQATGERELQATSLTAASTNVAAASLRSMKLEAAEHAAGSPAANSSRASAFATPAAAGSKPVEPRPGYAPAGTSRTLVAATPDEAENMLERVPALPTEGLYALDDQTPFNVLDSVYYDPSGNMLSLIGHFDSQYHGPKIPYLQHLAVLLKNPQPEFSLDWTPESERKVDAFFKQHVIEGMSASAADSLMAKWGELFDQEHNLTKAGRLLLPVLGVSPIDGGHAPGVIGVTVTSVPESTWVQIASIVPGSAAEAAGLRPGDIIKTIRGRAPLYPDEFYRRIRISGAGTSLNLTYQRPGDSRPSYLTKVTPTASSDPDPWKGMTRYDLLKALYFSAGDPRAANAMDILGMFYRDKTGRFEINTEIRGLLINALGLRGAVNADLKAVDDGTMTEVAAFRDIYHKICEGVDQCFHFQGTPMGDAYLEAIQRLGGDPGRGMRPAFDEFDRQILPKVKALLDPIFERPEGLQIPPELVEEQFHLHPEMVPQYLGLPADALLSRVLFDSDYLCKRLMNRPELKQKIPGYQTGFEFEVKNPQFRHGTGMYRVWISVAKMNTPQSTDGTTLALRDLAMRFNIRDQDGAKRDLPNQPGSYEELLTSLWHDFEVEYPTLHELRETAKLAAAARWMLAHNPSASLPEAGRLRWQGPGKVPGLMFMELAPDPVQGPAKTHVTTIAEGGVSEAPPAGFQGEPYPADTSVVDLRGSSFFSPPAGTHLYTATAPTQGASTTESSPFAEGWTSSAEPGADGKPKSAVVVTSTFGSKVVKADFAKSAPVTAGTDTKAGDQLLAAAATARTNPDNLTQNFDIGGARNAGSVNYGNVDASALSERVRNDARMVPILQRLADLQAKREQLNFERDQLTLARNQAKDREEMKRMTEELDKKDAEYQANLKALAEQKESVAKTKRLIDDEVESSPSSTPPTANPQDPQKKKPW